MSAPGLIIAAPASGSGKTVVTLALLRALRAAGVAVASFKAGPDYIDPTFHARASGRRCLNLDSWAMRIETLAGLTDDLARDAELVIGEGVMGLFDGAADGRGSTADLASLFDLPVSWWSTRAVWPPRRPPWSRVHQASRRRRGGWRHLQSGSERGARDHSCGAPATTGLHSPCWAACPTMPG